MSSTLTDADKVIKQSSLMLNAADQKVRSPTSEDNDCKEWFWFYHSQKVFELRSLIYEIYADVILMNAKIIYKILLYLGSMYHTAKFM